MNFDLLIDNIVRQTTVLIAQLATAAGGRAPLAHVANQVFLSLVAELKDQGLGNKVIADMFGLALRTYHNRVRRYAESATDAGVSLWEAVLSFIGERETVYRSELLARFHREDEEILCGVIRDLVDSGLVYQSGRADSTMYRLVEATPGSSAGDERLRTANLVWVSLHQRGASTKQELCAQLALPGDMVDQALTWLLDEGRAKRLESRAPEVDERYEVDHCVIPYGDEHGWEAALFDHYQAMVTAVAAKVRSGATRARAQEASGGSTYHFDLQFGHPLEAEVLAFLSDVRRRASKLRDRVNALRDLDSDGYRVVFYAGQNVIGRDENGETAEE